MVAKTRKNNKVGFSKETYLNWYEQMLLMRRFEEKAGQLYGQQKISGFCHLYIGQEACAAGSVSALIKGDKYRLQQLFQNLITNAINYNDKEKGIIEIGFADQNDFWQFYVKDNGKGIAETYFNKIFKTFQKLENNPISTGIGLSIVKKIIDLYGGKIWLESSLGIGTTFYFTLKKEPHGET